jgi:hypothetical protein
MLLVSRFPGMIVERLDEWHIICTAYISYVRSALYYNYRIHRTWLPITAHIITPTFSWLNVLGGLLLFIKWIEG